MSRWRAFLPGNWLPRLFGLRREAPPEEPEILPPVEEPTKRRFRPDRPRLLVLLYGASEDPAVTLAEPKPGTLEYARYKWGFEIVRNLLGSDGATLHSFGGEEFTEDNWETHELDKENGNNYFFAPQEVKTGETPPLCAVFPCRDGSVHLVEQLRCVLDDTYRLYNERFGDGDDAPDLVFITHSMAGNLIRALLSSPAEEIEGLALTSEERERADFLRDRTLYAVTFAGTHEGSCVADKADDIRAFLTTALEPIRGVMNMMNIWEQVMVFLSATTAIHQMETALWKRLNVSTLAPHKMRRTDGSLIPLYALSGRFPAGQYYRDPAHYPLGGIPLTELLHTRPALEAIGLMALDWAMYNAPGCCDTWGCPFCEDLPLDTQARYFKKKLGFELSAPGERPGEGEIGFPIFYVDGEQDGHTDADGMVSIDSALGVRLGTDLQEYFDHRELWTIEGQEMRGSWYRLYAGPWRETNHGSILQDAQTGEWLHKCLLSVAGPYPGPGEFSVWEPEVPASLLPPVSAASPPLDGAGKTNGAAPDRSANEASRSPAPTSPR